MRCAVLGSACQAPLESSVFVKQMLMYVLESRTSLSEVPYNSVTDR